MTTLVPQLTGMPAAQLEGALDLVKETGLGLNLALPGADAAAAPAPAEFPGFTPVDLGDLNAPIINAALQVDAAGNVTQIGNIVMADVKSAGLPLPAITLPANVMDILKSTGAKQVGIVTNGQGHADITLDGQPALSLDFDAAALQKLLAVLKPLLNVALLDNPIVSQLLDTVVMPVAPGAKLNLTVALP
jgi:hypothetical protein